MFDEFAAWLREVVTSALTAGEPVVVVHHAPPEPTYLRRILGQDAVADLLPHFVDLLAFLREHFVGVHGLGSRRSPRPSGSPGVTRTPAGSSRRVG